MKLHNRRVYRDWVACEDLVSYSVTVGSTDLYVSTSRELRREAEESTSRHRRTIQDYLRSDPRFATSLEPVRPLPGAPAIIRTMAEAGHIAGVGPMAAVAGAIAEAVGRDLLPYSTEVIVENGGDIFMAAARPRTVGLYAGDSPLTGRVAIEVRPDDSPLGICTSSGTVGHSLSFGRADACTVLACSAAVADALATALCNRIRTPPDLDRVLDPGRLPVQVIGLLAVIENRVGLQGTVRLVRLRAQDR